MDNYFSDTNEKLYRAVREKHCLKADGKSISSAALYDPNGLSVERGGDREDSRVCDDMHIYLHGSIAMFRVGVCRENAAVLRYLPSRNNVYHSEVHGSETEKALTQGQRKRIARAAVIVG